VDESAGPEKTRRRFAGDLMVPVLLLAAIAGWFLLAQQPAVVSQVASTVVPTASPTVEPDEAAATPFGLPGLATPWAEVVPETPPPVVATAVVPEPIVPLGPPAGASFRAGDVVSFYWAWPRTLTATQRFALYGATGERLQLLGTVAEANLGTLYQLQIPVETFGEQTGSYQWWIVLEDEASTGTIGASEPRPLAILGG
jgi:hypothetical protein